MTILEKIYTLIKDDVPNPTPVVVYTQCGPTTVTDVGMSNGQLVFDTEGCCPDLMECDREALRKMLREACIEMCHDCPSSPGPEEDHGYRCVVKTGGCFVQKLRVAVGMNGGEP